MIKSQGKKLNKEQLAAVQHGQGPLLIIAGAGTGKTTVITERIKYLITKKLAKPSEILALTFTDKASREMEERVDLALPYGYTEMWISTFHSFCDRVLRQEGLRIGLSSDYHLMTQAESTQFLINHLFHFNLKYFRPRGNPTKFVDGLLQHFSRLKDEDIDARGYLKYSQKQPDDSQTLELAQAYQTYEELKIKENLLDFGDLITSTLKLFRTRKNILKNYQQQFKYFLVDEYQDTNIAQNELVILLVGPPAGEAGKKANLTVVADDDQCLPPNAQVATPKKEKKIKDIEAGDEVVTAVGKGYTSISKVSFVKKTKKRARFLTFTTNKGTKITVTDNHKMFCYVPPRVYEDRNFYYVYLMHRKNLGWRLGTTNDLAQRLRLERSADRIIGAKACYSEQEARYFETVYSLKYGLPTTAFKPRAGMAITGEWLERLYKEFDTEKSVQRLAQDLHLDLDSHHCCLSGVFRGGSRRIKINLRLCKRRHRTKWARGRYLLNPKVYHEVAFETSDVEAIKKLHNAGVKLLPRKKGKGLRKTFSNLVEAGRLAKKLSKITGGILECKFDVAKKSGYAKQALVMSASNVLPGHYLPVLKNYEIIYEKIVNIESKEKQEEVYDLEIEETHNFIADGVVVHNSIYKWRGAAVSNVIQFKKHFPQTKIITLTKNYRSTQTILDHAYQLIQNNNPDRLEVKEKISKKLKSVRGLRGEKIEFLHADRVENEADLVAKKILELIKEKYDYKDFAILVRANNHAEPFARALSRAGIPYQFLGPGQLFRQSEVKDLIAYLKLLDNFEDNVAVYKVLAMSLWDISGRDLAAINNYGRRMNLSLFEACELVDRIFVSSQTKEKIAKFVKMVHRHLDLAPKETAGQILYYFLQDSGLLQHLAEVKTTLEEKQSQNMAKFFDRLKTYEVDHEDASVSAVVNWLNLSMQLGESPLASNFDWSEENKVNLLTIHSAKGLEFPIVFLVNLVASRFPTYERREQIPIPEALIKEILPEGDYHLQEERRLFYVGMTRAKDRLFLTAADYYGEGKREKKISPFVIEALGQRMIIQPAEAPVSQLSIFDFRPAEQIPNQEANYHFPINYLSYSQIETFNTCPAQYKYRYLKAIPVLPSAAASFGNSLHQTLFHFYQLVKKGEKLTLDDLLKLLEQNWSSLGFSSQAHEQRMKKEAKKMLSDFFQKAYDPAKTPFSLEQIFVTRINPTLKVGGKIDRVDFIPQGLEIIDYKTGKVWEQKQVDKSLQMTVYALAAADKGIYNKNPDEIALSFYFLETGEKKSTKRTIQQLEQAKKELIEKAKEIEKSNFAATPGIWCDFCDYKLLCEAWK